MTPGATTRAAERLTAVTVNSDGHPGNPPEGSQVSAFTSPRRTLWGEGEALRIEIPAPWVENLSLIDEVMAAIEIHDEVQAPGTGPVAFGSLPFDRSRPASLIIPAVIHGHTAEGVSWTTTVTAASDPTSGTAGGSRFEVFDPDFADSFGGAGFGSADNACGPMGCEVSPVGDTAGRGAAELSEPSSISVSAVRPATEWREAVSRARQLILQGELTKVVLAREISVSSDRPIDPATLFARLHLMYPTSMSFAVDGFVGASPELLVSRIGEIVRAHPMAGTTPRSGEPEVDQQRAAELLSSEKNRAEHQITIDMVHDTLLPWTSYLDAEPTPSVVQAGPVQHLATMVEGRLSRPTPSITELVAALHPTPAVGGWPRDEALRTIAELELADRGPYAGPVGWVDSEGNGAFAVGIRSVKLTGTEATLFAGVGVVADSDPLSELEETRAKAQSLLGALIRV